MTIDKSFVDDLDIDSLSMEAKIAQFRPRTSTASKRSDEDLAGLVGDAVGYIQKLEAENADLAAELREKFELTPDGRASERTMTKPSTRNGNFPNVVVTSLAATTSITGDVDATWKGLLNGESGIDVLDDDFIHEYDLPVRIGT